MADVDLNQFDQYSVLLLEGRNRGCPHGDDPEVIGLYDKRTGDYRGSCCQHCGHVELLPTQETP